ncbi:hypothetical protein DFP73DRAFT_236485 [Morchella snyderi]|nr:hypothetical protein DFP73DRAFT_236485 [Morchella snyderi]
MDFIPLTIVLSFFCPSCTFKPNFHPLMTHLNPLAADPPGPNHLKWTCSQSRHGPYCIDCEDSEKSHLTCIDCHGSLCYGCHGPSGTTISSSLYTTDGWTTEIEKDRFGVVGRIDEWEIGAYLGWGGVDESEPQTSDLQEQDLADKFTGVRGVYGHSTLPCNNIDKPTSPDNIPEAFRGTYESMSSYNNIMSEVLVSLKSTPRNIDSGPTPASPLSESPKVILDDYGDPFRRMCETRIWEQCARCGIGTCASCLGYEEDLYEPGGPKYIIQEPEYRSCYAGCGKRFCLSCINRPTNGPGELVCGAIWTVEKDSEYQIDEFLYRGITDVPGAEANGGKCGKGVRCGAVLCAECQDGEMLIRPTIVQREGEVEVADEKEREGVETERRQNDRRGVWRCARCELGIRPVNM